MSRRVYVWMFAWLLMAGVAGAQQGTAEVRGRVLDGTGAALPGVTVTIKNQDTGIYSMNKYSLKVYTTVLGATCAKRDGG